MASPTPQKPIERIAAFDDRIVITLSDTVSWDVRVAASPVYVTDPSEAVELSGRRDGNRVTVPRHAHGRDLLYDKFWLGNSATGQVHGEPHFVNDLSGLAARNFDFLNPGSIKGITCPVDIDDMAALGVKHLNTNVNFANMIDWGNPNPEAVEVVNGVEVPINVEWFRQWLDAQVKPYTEMGIDVMVVLNNPLPGAGDPPHAFVHPKSDIERAPNRLGAFNLTDEAGLVHYVAALRFMAERYSRPDAEYGWISGYIVGNEVNSHWYWYNMGEVRMEEFTDDYKYALRIADLAVRSVHPGIRSYLLLEHHWTVPFSFNKGQAFTARPFLDYLNERVQAQGDFPWHVAFHPYPENLFEPDFWNDEMALMAFDTPKVTFKNAEVLSAYLAQPRFLHEDRMRSIIFSEQGFHARLTPEGEDEQAAAYAYAFYRVSRIPGVDIFHLHRHVSHPGEGGLHLGVRHWGDSGHAHDMGRKYKLYDVFRAADTPEWEEAFAFALPIIGYESWDQADPTPLDQVAVETPGMAEAMASAGELLFDLCDLFGEGKYRNEGSLDLRPDRMARNGVFMQSLFHHPPAEGVGDAVFDIPLPSLADGQRLVFDFAIAIKGQSDDGVRYSVLADGQVLWTLDVIDNEARAFEIDLTPYAGRGLELRLRVEAIDNIENDWSTWIRPQVVIKG